MWWERYRQWTGVFLQHFNDKERRDVSTKEEVAKLVWSLNHQRKWKKVHLWLDMHYHRHIMMLMISALWTRQRQQHVNKATGELAWKHGVQRSLDARRGRGVLKRQRDKTDDCCLFVVAVFPLSNSSLYPFTPCRSSIPSFPCSLFFSPPCSPSLSSFPLLWVYVCLISFCN